MRTLLKADSANLGLAPPALLHYQGWTDKHLGATDRKLQVCDSRYVICKPFCIQILAREGLD